MRPIINCLSSDSNDPFPPVNSANTRNRNPRSSLLPRKSLVPKAIGPKSIGPANRPSLNIVNRPSLALPNRPSSTVKSQSQVEKNKVAKFTKTAAATSIQKSGNELPVIMETTPRERPPPVDSMFTQLTLETTIEKNEKKLNAFFADFKQPSLANLGRKLFECNWQGTEAELGELAQLHAKLTYNQEEYALRKEFVEKARQDFMKVLEKQADYVTAELDMTNGMKERLNGLLTKFENKMGEGTSQQCFIRPAMVDKEVQVIPLRTFFNSPNFNASIQRNQLPISPILRTAKKGQTPSHHTNKENRSPETPTNWSEGRDKFPTPTPLNFDETRPTFFLNPLPPDTTYVLSKPAQQAATTRYREMTFRRSLSANDIQPRTPVLRTDVKKLIQK